MDDNTRPHRSRAVTARISCCDSCCHSWCNAASNWRMFCTGGSRACMRWPNMSQLCSMGLKSGLVAEHAIWWCLARRGWNLRTWRKIHWSVESRFLLHVTDGRMRFWRHKNKAYSPRNRKTRYSRLGIEKTRPQNRGKCRKKTRCFLCNLYNNVIIYKIKKIVRTVLSVNEFTEFSYLYYKGISGTLGISIFF
jgi:hypothetical protein